MNRFSLCNFAPTDTITTSTHVFLPTQLAVPFLSEQRLPKKSKRLENQGVYLLLVAEAGLEHATSRLWAWRATNCSTPRCNHKQSNRCDQNLNCGCKGTAFGRNHQITERNNERFNSYLTHSYLLRSQAPSIFATNRMWHQDNTYLYNKECTKAKKRISAYPRRGTKKNEPQIRNL